MPFRNLAYTLSLAVLVGLISVGLPESSSDTEVQAQSVVTLVSNNAAGDEDERFAADFRHVVGHHDFDEDVTGTEDYVQAVSFTTGSNSGGYSISTVEDPNKRPAGYAYSGCNDSGEHG